MDTFGASLMSVVGSVVPARGEPPGGECGSVVICQHGTTKNQCSVVCFFICKEWNREEIHRGAGLAYGLKVTCKCVYQKQN